MEEQWKEERLDWHPRLYWRLPLGSNPIVDIDGIGIVSIGFSVREDKQPDEHNFVDFSVSDANLSWDNLRYEVELMLSESVSLVDSGLLTVNEDCSVSDISWQTDFCRIGIVSKYLWLNAKLADDNE